LASTQTPEIATRPELEGGTPDAPAPEEGGRQLLLFRAGGRLYGCDIATVREIIPFRRCTRLPGAPAYVCGLTNLRGTVVTVVDLAERLGAEPGAEGRTRPAALRTDGSIIVAEHGAKVAGLAVDSVRDVQVMADDRMADDAAAPAATAASAEDGAVVRGLGQLGDEVVIVLDVQTILRQVLA
jgi:purine-binding chemotaxis protein CheW